jgi:hypothetical protein
MKAFLIPGNGEGLKSRNYQAVLDLYKELGYEPHFVPIEWRYKTIDSWVAQVQAHIPQKDLENSILSGFSFGSMIAFCVAARVNPKKLLLFSLSPYFKEDMPLPLKWENWQGKRRMERFRQLSFNDLAPNIKCPTILFLGSVEKEKYQKSWERTQVAHRRIKGSRVVLSKDVAHNVEDPKYTAAIKEALN